MSESQMKRPDRSIDGIASRVKIDQVSEVVAPYALAAFFSSERWSPTPPNGWDLPTVSLPRSTSFKYCALRASGRPTAPTKTTPSWAETLSPENRLSHSPAAGGDRETSTGIRR